MRFEYPAKILLAWSEAISGNVKIRDWLMKNGYPELALFVFALHHKADAREWLLKNKHPHLLALIEAAEGRALAMEWLRKNKLDVLEQMALCADDNDEALAWLIDHKFKEMALIAMKIREVKDDIEADNNDPHKISKD